MLFRRWTRRSLPHSPVAPSHACEFDLELDMTSEVDTLAPSSALLDPGIAGLLGRRRFKGGDPMSPRIASVEGDSDAICGSKHQRIVSRHGRLGESSVSHTEGFPSDSSYYSDGPFKPQALGSGDIFPPFSGSNPRIPSQPDSRLDRNLSLDNTGAPPACHRVRTTGVASSLGTREPKAVARGKQQPVLRRTTSLGVPSRLRQNGILVSHLSEKERTFSGPARSLKEELEDYEKEEVQGKAVGKGSSISLKAELAEYEGEGEDGMGKRCESTEHAMASGIGWSPEQSAACSRMFTHSSGSKGGNLSSAARWNSWAGILPSKLRKSLNFSLRGRRTSSGGNIATSDAATVGSIRSISSSPTPAASIAITSSPSHSPFSRLSPSPLSASDRTSSLDLQHVLHHLNRHNHSQGGGFSPLNDPSEARRSPLAPHFGTSTPTHFSSRFSEATTQAAPSATPSQVPPSSPPDAAIGGVGDPSRLAGLPDGGRSLTESQLREATNGFAQANFLGRGSFGSVYRGQLFGRQVAVKRLEGNTWQGEAEYETEVGILSSLRHPHIVLLMGHCPEDMSLVYEYLPGGSLQDYLQLSASKTTSGQRNAKGSSAGSSRSDNSGSSSSSSALGKKAAAPNAARLGTPTSNSSLMPQALSWRDRVRIIREAASALLFLHRCNPPVVHHDLKPDNLLLDKDLHCKLSDVGLACLLEDESTSSSVGMRGTAGYIDPYEILTCEMSLLSDVYALGLIMLQLLLLEPSVIRLHQVVQKIRDELPSELREEEGGGRNVEAMAEVLLESVREELEGEDVELARRVATLGLLCSDRERGRRPDMAAVSAELDSLNV